MQTLEHDCASVALPDLDDEPTLSFSPVLGRTGCIELSRDPQAQ